MTKRSIFILSIAIGIILFTVLPVLAQLPSRDSNTERAFENNVQESYGNAGVRNTTNAPFTFAEQNVLREIINDFRVNDDTTSLSDQNLPSIARDLAGNFVIAWRDQRSGFSLDIYAQRYNSAGTPLGSNFKVNDDISLSIEQNCPSVAIDALGNFVITWHDFRNGSNPGYLCPEI
jgi:hypothetical protein